MKRVLAITVLGLMVVCALAAQSSAANLDAAIQQASKAIGTYLPTGANKVALLNCVSPSADLSNYILDEMAAALSRGRTTILTDRKTADNARGKLKVTDQLSDAEAKQIGGKLKVDFVVSGTLTKTGEVYRFRTKLTSITSPITPDAASINVNIKDSTSIISLLPPAPAPAAPPAPATAAAPPAPAAPPPPPPAAAPAPAPAAAPPAPVAPAPASAVKTYKIGDTGPAGGFIFYDKGNDTGGWRYLEAAPADITRKLKSTTENIDVSNCKEREVGRGKSNTAAIMAEANQKGGGFDWAARECDMLEINGFDDWFLPSRDELNYMYGNLHRKGLGNFRTTDNYWSSTAQSNNYYWAENFSTGKQDNLWYTYEYHVRPVRQF